MADAGSHAPAAGGRSVALALLPALASAVLVACAWPGAAGAAAAAAASAVPPPLAASSSDPLSSGTGTAARAGAPLSPLAIIAAALPAPAGVGAAVVNPSGFTLRRVPNPRYRPPVSAAQALGIGTVGPLRAIDHLRFQVAQRGGAGGFSEWQLMAGEQRRDRSALDFSATGESRNGRSALRTIAMQGRQGDLIADLGDVPNIALGRLGSLQRLRGLSVISAPRSGISWRGVSGVPTPVPGLVTPRMGLAGAMIEHLKRDESSTAIALFGFERGRVSAANAAMPGDTLPGGGGAATVDVRTPLPLGALVFAVGAQLHDLEGSMGLAAQQTLGWSLGMPAFALDFVDERATGRARLLRTDGLTPAARREDRWNAQARLLRGRVETHFTGVVRDGGDPAVATHTMQVGGSGGWGGSSWYSGADLYLTRRVLEGVDERRLSLYSGRISSAGHALLLRLDRTTDDLGRDNTQAAAEVAVALARGARLSIEPRCAWDAKQAQQANVDLRVTCPLRRLAARLSGFVSVGAQRGDGFRAAMHEAALAVSLVPRARDRADVEVRRRDEPGLATYETTASYDLSAQRYENLRGPRSSHDEGLITVRVVRSGDRSGVADVLVLLDGRESRFTDASGVAHFEHASVGTHLVSVEERSLPAQHQVMTASRVFVTVERGRDLDPVTFEIARPVRRTKF